jgi:hypothetical protein
MKKYCIRYLLKFHRNERGFLFPYLYFIFIIVITVIIGSITSLLLHKNLLAQKYEQLHINTILLSAHREFQEYLAEGNLNDNTAHNFFYPDGSAQVSFLKDTYEAQFFIETKNNGNHMITIPIQK